MFDQRFERPTELLFFMYATSNVTALDGAEDYFCLISIHEGSEYNEGADNHSVSQFFIQSI